MHPAFPFLGLSPSIDRKPFATTDDEFFMVLSPLPFRPVSNACESQARSGAAAVRKVRVPAAGTGLREGREVKRLRSRKEIPGEHSGHGPVSWPLDSEYTLLWDQWVGGMGRGSPAVDRCGTAVPRACSGGPFTSEISPTSRPALRELGVGTPSAGGREGSGSPRTSHGVSAHATGRPLPQTQARGSQHPQEAGAEKATEARSGQEEQSWPEPDPWPSEPTLPAPAPPPLPGQGQRRRVAPCVAHSRRERTRCRR